MCAYNDKISAVVLLENLFVWPVLLYRYCRFGYTFRRIYLGEGKWTILDQEDYYRLRRFKWIVYGAGSNLYAVRFKLIGPNRTWQISMHREIMGPEEGMFVDHKNGNSLDNRRANLRFATRAENNRNRRKKKGATSRFLGVCFYRHKGKWASRIETGGKRILLGLFDSEIDAARAYDEAAKKYNGEFARLNFPQESEESRALFTRIGKTWAKLKKAIA
jgi:hypothetical protein